MIAPKVFISYAWTSQPHIEWVIRLASDLRSQGVDIILDKWDLKEGHDAYAYMERMVSDESVERVIMVCDVAYCQKADARAGGVGTEAQIISPALYAKKEQDKFVAVARERDAQGKAVVPTFYTGRIHIEMAEDDQYSDSLEQLVRWIYGKPQHIKPPIGKRPSFIDQSPDARTGNNFLHYRAMEALKRSEPNALTLSDDYFQSVLDGLSIHIIPFLESDDAFEDALLSSIESFTPTKNELIELFSSIGRHVDNEEASDAIVRFFEGLLRLHNLPEGVTRFRRSGFDNFKFISNELFLSLIASMIKREKFQFIDRVLSAIYLDSGHAGRSSSAQDFTVFAGFIEALEHRNRRLNLRKVSLKADMLIERCNASLLSSKDLIQADLILFMRSKFSELHGRPTMGRWFPHTLIYAYNYDGAFDLFIKSTSKKYFDKVKPIFSVETAEDFKSMVKRIEPIDFGNFNRFELSRFCNLDNIASR